MTIKELSQVARLRKIVRSGAARSLRVSAGLSQGEIAEAVGVTPAAICRYERAQRLPRRGVALRYLRVLEDLTREAV